MPSRSAVDLRRRRREPAPAALGASGRVSSAVTSCRAASRSSTSAPKGAVAATAIRAMRLPSRGGACGRSCAIASRRDSGSVRSMISVPSRWSSLVLDDPRREALELEVERLAVDVEAFERDLERALDRHPHRAEREAALLVDLGVLAGAVSTGLTTTRSSPSSLNTNSRRTIPTCVAARPTPSASCMSAIIRSASCSSSSSNASTSLAFIRSTGSPYWRTCASAICRRAAAPAPRPPRRRARAPRGRDRRGRGRASWSWSWS